MEAYHCSERKSDLLLNSCNCSAAGRAHKESSGFVGNLIRASDILVDLDSVSKRAVVD